MNLSYVMRFVILSAIFLVSFPRPGMADPMLAWDPSMDEVAGYKIYFGTEYGQYPGNVDVGNVTEFSIAKLNLQNDRNYFITVRAYDKIGESEDSNVVSWPDTAIAS